MFAGWFTPPIGGWFMPPYIQARVVYVHLLTVLPDDLPRLLERVIAGRGAAVELFVGLRREV